MAKKKKKSAQSETTRDWQRLEARMYDEGEGLDVKMEMTGLRKGSLHLWKELATALIAVITEADAECGRCQGAEGHAMIHLSGRFDDIRYARSSRELAAIMKRFGLSERWERAKTIN
jgi:hypothetical protein